MTSAIAAYGTLLKRSVKPYATLATGTAGANTGITWTAVTEGLTGNDVTVLLQNAGGTATLLVSVSVNDITVRLATTSGTITSIASDVITAVKASAAASALVNVDNTTTSTGAGTVSAVAQTNLAAGSDTAALATIAEVIGIKNSRSMEAFDVTSHDSASGIKEFIGGQISNTLSFDVNFIPTADSQSYTKGLEHDLKTRKARVFEVSWPSTTVQADFTGYVVGIDIEADQKGPLKASIEIQITGDFAIS